MENSTMKDLMAEPDIRQVTQLLPIDEMETRLEYIQKIEKGQRAFRKNPSWGFAPYQYATLMNLPLKTLESYAQHGAVSLCASFQPIGKFLAHFFKREQSEEGPETSQEGLSEPPGRSVGTPSSASGSTESSLPPSASEMQKQKGKTRVYRSKETRRWAKHYDKRSISKPPQLSQGRFYVFFAPDNTLALAFLSSGLGASDKTWNMICLSPQLQTWWSHGYFGLKYLGHEDDEETGMSTAELQFVWMPHSHYGKSTKRIDLNEEQDKARNIRVCLEHMFGGEPPCSPHCDRCEAISKVQAHKVREHYTIESGYVFPVVRRTEDIQKFKAMIQLQWAAICVGSMSGAANHPELLVGDEDDNNDEDDDDYDYDDDDYEDNDYDDNDDDDNDDNQPAFVAPDSNRIEDWLESVQKSDDEEKAAVTPSASSS